QPPADRAAPQEDWTAAAHAVTADDQDQVVQDHIEPRAERRSIEDAEADVGTEVERQAAGQSPLAAAARLGSEALGRLRARYAEVMTRISERPMDEAAREELKTRVQRLNPDMWVTSDEVAQALEEYETVFETLRGVIGGERRRRRGRRHSGRREGSGGNGQV
ncbi:MAG TPA: hypothetical protein VGL62_10255, partial [Vicinamibacterales bacterium]